MSLAPGTRLGPYELVAVIGAGGMGAVYRARDTRLHRDVAVKVLPPEVSSDADRLRRFEEEARAAASLNHSNILALYDIGTDNGVSYIVTELLDGRTLGHLIADERLATSRVIDLAAQIADGLAAAHSRNIVHRDLKPENVFVTTDGRAKLLDFGLAKTVRPGDAVEGPSQSATAPNVVLGTAGYMAPEQLRGQPVDHRTDIFTFGAVVYEMVTGRRAFVGETALDSMSAILHAAPAAIVSTPDRPVPPSLLRIVERCLEKSPAARFQSTTDLAFALKALSQSESVTLPFPRDAALVPGRWRWRQAVPWVLTAALAAALVLMWQPWRPAPAVADDAIVRFTIGPPAGMRFGLSAVSPFPAISPDGQQLVFHAERDNVDGMWIRPLGGLDARPLGVSGGQPFWSPDSRTLAFFSENKLKRLDLTTNVVQTICDSQGVTGGGTWSPSGVIVFFPVRGVAGGGGPLMQVQAGGGTPSVLTTLDKTANQTSHRHAWFLPDGRRFLYQSAPDNIIWVGSLDGGPPKRVTPSDSRAVFVAPEWLVFVRENTLLVQRFDLGRLEVEGDPIPLAEDVRTNEINGRSAFTLSSNGILVYRTGDQTQEAVLTWVDRAAKVRSTVPESGARYEGFQLLPDERHVVAHIHDDAQGGGDLWKIDLDRGTRARLTSDPAHDHMPVLSPDGAMVAWRSSRTTPSSIFRKSSDGAGEERVWIQMDRDVAPLNWSKNWLVFEVIGKAGTPDLWVAPADGGGPPRPYLETEFLESFGRLSPDERWMAYHSNESGQMEVYVRPFPDAQSAKWQISSREGGGGPHWRRDGREIIYGVGPAKASPGGRVMAVPVTTSGTTLDAGTPVDLGSLPGVRGGLALSKDGQSALVALAAEATHADAPLTVVVNWMQVLAQRSRRH